MDKQAYQYGFNAVCSKLGIDAKELVKSAAELPTLEEQTTGNRVMASAGKGGLIGEGLGVIAGLVLRGAIAKKLGTPVSGMDAILGGVIGGGVAGTGVGAVMGAKNKPSLKEKARGALGTLSQKLK